MTLRQIYHQPLGFAAARPNTPVLPFGAVTAKATFIDPSVRITNGQHVVIGSKTLIGPQATLNAATGFIKIGSASTVEDNATIISNPTHAAPTTTSVLIGDNVVIHFGAVVQGPSTIGAYGTPQAPAAALPTEIGPNALIDGAIIKPGAIVGALARVGPDVTVPSGVFVRPGANITSNADLSNPSKVRAVTATDRSEITATLSNSQALVVGFTTLYQGNSATGASPGPIGTPVTGVNNGNLAAVEGASSEAGSPTVSFEPGALPGAVASPFPTSATAPKFLSHDGRLLQANLFNFPARVVGQVDFLARAHQVAHHLGRSNSIRADQGQPIGFSSTPTTGPFVTINSPLAPTTTAGGALPIGENLRVGSGAVVLGGPPFTIPTIPGRTFTPSIGNNVTIGSGAVVNDSNLGNGVTIGDRAFVSQSTIPAGTTVAPGAIIINNVPMGSVQWTP